MMWAGALKQSGLFPMRKKSVFEMDKKMNFAWENDLSEEKLGYDRRVSKLKWEAFCGNGHIPAKPIFDSTLSWQYKERSRYQRC